MSRHSILCVALMAALAGCQTTSDPAPAKTEVSKPATAPAAPAKEPTFYEIASGDTVYVFASVASANNHLSGIKLKDPVSKPGLKPGKTVVFENVGANTDALIAAWAKANNVKLK